MSKRKGVSAEEKRIRVLQLFHEKKDFFQLKELEKIAPKEKGIIQQSVKDVIQSLVDDGLVDTDKIGSSIYYWAFPSKTEHQKKVKLHEVEKKCDELNQKLQNINDALEKARLGREDCEEREKSLQKIKKLKEEKVVLEAKLMAHMNSDPKIIETLRDDIQKAKEAANNWTDNLFAVKSWCKNKFMVEGDVMDRQFGIPPDLDYVE